MKQALLAVLCALSGLSLVTGTAFAQATPLKVIAIGKTVTLAPPSDGDDVLTRLTGVQCVAASKLLRNPDGSYNGSVTCGAVTLKSKRLALDTDFVGRAPTTGSLVPLSDAKIMSGEVTILAIGSGDLFSGRAAELVGKACKVTKPLTRDPKGYYAGELTCGKDRFYFAEVQLAGGSGLVAIGGIVATPPNAVPGVLSAGPQIGQRWRITDAGDVYPGINTTDCLRWPTPEMKLRGGDQSWGSYAPTAGDVGQVVGVTRHCSQEIDVVFLQVGAYVVPIGVHGIERAPN